MERRDFLKNLMAGAAVGATPLSTLAGPLFDADGLAVTIVSQRELPQAAALAGNMAQMLAAAGATARQVVVGSADLADVARIGAILDAAPDAPLIGVMDDAAAVIFQAVATARGAGIALHTQHRQAGGAMRHCCTASMLEDKLVWSDGGAMPASRVARLYAETASGRRLSPAQAAQVTATASPQSGAATAVSLVSFVINT